MAIARDHATWAASSAWDPLLVRCLKEQGLTSPAEAALALNETQLMSLLACTLSPARAHLTAIYAALLPAPTTALTLARAHRQRVAAFIPSPLRSLGGLHASLLEVCGAAGAGKTQFALSAAAAAVLNLESAYVAYVDTEGAFDAARLLEIISEQLDARRQGASEASSAQAAGGSGGGGSGNGEGGGGGGCVNAADMLTDADASAPCSFLGRGALGIVSDAQASALLSRIICYRAASVSDLLRVVSSLPERIEAAGSLKLLVIDSIASASRAEFDAAAAGEGAERGGEYAAWQRSDSLARLAAALKYTAEAHNVCVLITNQIAVGPGALGAEALGAAAGGEFATDFDVLLPALGPTWSHSVNTRLYLTHGGSFRGSGLGTCTVVKSPSAARAVIPYQITRAGLLERAQL